MRVVAPAPYFYRYVKNKEMIMTPRDEAQCEVSRDLKKSPQHLLIDAYEELLKKYPTFDENIIHFNKRMSALTAKSIITMKRLTYLIAILTAALVVLTIVLVVKT
jgi:hypothetical protein